MDTAPLPPVGRGRIDDDATAPIAPVPAGVHDPGGSGPGASAGRPGPALRALEAVAGLLSGGLLLLGLALLALQLLAPELAPGTGLSAPSGPGWWRVAAQLGVGVAGELTVLARRRAGRPARWLLGAAVIVAALAVLWFAWLA